MSLISVIDQHGLLNKDGIIMAEHGDDVVLPDSIGELVKVRAEKTTGLQQFRFISMKVRGQNDKYSYFFREF